MLSHMVFDQIIVPVQVSVTTSSYCGVLETLLKKPMNSPTTVLHYHVIRAPFVLLYFKDADFSISLRLDHFSVSL